MDLLLSGNTIDDEDAELLGKLVFSVVEWVEKYAISWHVVMREKDKVMFST